MRVFWSHNAVARVTSFEVQFSLIRLAHTLNPPTTLPPLQLCILFLVFPYLLPHISSASSSFFLFQIRYKFTHVIFPLSHNFNFKSLPVFDGTQKTVIGHLAVISPTDWISSSSHIWARMVSWYHINIIGNIRYLGDLLDTRREKGRGARKSGCALFSGKNSLKQ